MSVQGSEFLNPTLRGFLPCTFFCTGLHAASSYCCRDPVPFAPVIRPWFPMPVPLGRVGVLPGVRTEKAEEGSVLSACSVFRGSTKYMFVPLASRKEKNPPVLPSEKFF